VTAFHEINLIYARTMTTEDLATWYFRLNGFFTITNFVVHPSRRGSQRTDADIVGVRFPYRSEFPDGPGGDEPDFTRIENRPYLVIAEVKRGLCRLNGPWTDAARQNIHAVLRNLGPFPQERIEEAALALYGQGVFECDQCIARCTLPMPRLTVGRVVLCGWQAKSRSHELIS
jgi:hypothetical protein